MNENREKFQKLLRELFQFDSTDLDFGIYRIMNFKREVIEQFIEKDLPDGIARELSRGALAEQSTLANELEIKKKEVLQALGEEALDDEDNLDEMYRNTPVGKQYLDLQARATGVQSRPALETAIFNHLFSFFNRYYDNGDFMSRRRYSKKERYAIPYNGEEVHLHWANSDQYYIKTGEHFTNYTFKSHDITVRFDLRNADVEQNNVKGSNRFFFPLPGDVNYNPELHEIVIPFEYRPLTEQESITFGNRDQQKKIISQAVASITEQFAGQVEPLAALVVEKRRTADGDPISFLEHHLNRYTRINSSDFFIHKDLKGFLERELDFYLKNEVLNLDELQNGGETRAEGWFQMMRTIKAIGHQIIAFLAQIENFQKRLFEKKKFITEVNYCITLNHIPEEFYPEIVANEAQRKEWVNLFAIEEIVKDTTQPGYAEPLSIEFLRAFQTLVLDTKHFGEDFKDRLLTNFEDIDTETDGLLIHSENFQALNLLQDRYREKVKCVYIDPPYNTSASKILYKNDYKHSSWLSLVNDRIVLSRNVMTYDSNICITIDDIELNKFSIILNFIFGSDNKVAIVPIRINPSGRPSETGFALTHEYALFYRKTSQGSICRIPRTNIQLERFDQKDSKGIFEYRNLRREGSNSDRIDGQRQYYPIFSDLEKETIRIPSMVWNEDKREWLVDEEPLSHEVSIYPINDDGREKNWRWSEENVRKDYNQFLTRIPQNGTPQVYYKYRPRTSGTTPLTLWTDTKYSATEYGTRVLKNLFITSVFPYPKSIYAVEDCIRVSGAADDKYAVILDFFAGSGTTAHAVINLNREDKGERKFILVEMGDYFDTVLLPRVKKVIFTPEWKDGKPKRIATDEEAVRSPRIIKYIRLESYEDSLNNIVLDKTTGQRMLQFGNDYLLNYMLDFESKDCETFLHIEQLESPFSYQSRSPVSSKPGKISSKLSYTRAP